jgi:hypothetical protein
MLQTPLRTTGPGAAARLRSAGRRRVPRVRACPSGGRSAAGTHLVTTAARAPPALGPTVPRTAPSTSTADQSVVRKRCNHPLRPRTFLRQPPLPRPQHGFPRPESVSRISVAQPGLSQGSATVVRMRHLLGYARVSTADQQPHLQGRRPPASRLAPGVHRDRQRRPHRRPMHSAHSGMAACTARLTRRPPAPRPRRSPSP